MCQEDGGGRKRRGKRRRASHIPGLMHGAIDSGSIPEQCPHFNERVEGGRRGRSDGRRRGVVYTCMCKKKEREGRLLLTPEWR